MASWYLAPALDELRTEVNTRWPNRSKAVDGTIGDAAHAARKSEHNPEVSGAYKGRVDAMDMTVDGIDANLYIKAAIADPRTWYVIHKGTIWSRTYGFKPHKYAGANPHNEHVHISLYPGKAGGESEKAWGIGAVKEKPPVDKSTTGTWTPEMKDMSKRGVRTIKRWSHGVDVQLVQRYLGLKDDGYYGPKTEERVKAWQMSQDLEADGIVGPKSWKVLKAALKNF